MKRAKKPNIAVQAWDADPEWRGALEKAKKPTRIEAPAGQEWDDEMQCFRPISAVKAWEPPPWRVAMVDQAARQIAAAYPYAVAEVNPHGRRILVCGLDDSPKLPVTLRPPPPIAFVVSLIRRRDDICKIEWMMRDFKGYSQCVLLRASDDMGEALHIFAKASRNMKYPKPNVDFYSAYPSNITQGGAISNLARASILRDQIADAAPPIKVPTIPKQQSLPF